MEYEANNRPTNDKLAIINGYKTDNFLYVDC